MQKGCFWIWIAVFVFFQGCAPAQKGNRGSTSTYPYAYNSEAEWIRNGDPIEFEGEMWYPKDSVETLLDSEVLLLGEYKDVQFFVDKIDVRPYARLYTKFNSKRFRVFKRAKE